MHVLSKGLQGKKISTLNVSEKVDRDFIRFHFYKSKNLLPVFHMADSVRQTRDRKKLLRDNCC